MAKKRKKDKKEEEEYEFTPPEFDEKEFLKKEIKDTKTAIWTIGYAGVFGIIAGEISALGRSLVAPSILVALIGIVFLRYFYQMLDIDIGQFTRKNWVGNIGTFFFTFLAIWVLMVNVPFMDLANPSVDKVIVWVDDGTTIRGLEYKFVDARGIYDWVPISNDSWSPVIHTTTTTTVNITARVTDNGHLSVVEVAIGSTSTYYSMTGYDTKRFQYQFTGDKLVAGQGLMFYVRAGDRVGNSVVFNPQTTIPVTT
jgi:hypothetical protein